MHKPGGEGLARHPEGESRSRGCCSERHEGKPALLHPAGISAPMDAGPRAPASHHGRDGRQEQPPGARAPSAGASSFPSPPPPTFTAQRCLLSSAPSPSGALNPPLPSSRGGGLSPRGRKQAGSSPGCQGRFSLHSTGTPSSSLLGPGARAGTPESQSPNPSARTSQALDGARATGGRQKSWSGTRVQGLLSTVLRPFIHPPFVQVSPHTTLIKYPLESWIPAAAPSDVSSRALTVGAQHPDQERDVGWP